MMNTKDIKGFTIAEMLTVIIVIGILFSIVGRSYFAERERFEFNESFNQILGMIKTAKNAAITNEAVFSDSDGKRVIPTSGYGVYINRSPKANDPHFVLFASLGDDDQNPSTKNIQYDKGLSSSHTDVVLETYRLPIGVDFQFLIFDEDGQGLKEQITPDAQSKSKFSPTKNEAVVFFRPPLAEVYLGDQLGKGLEEIQLRFYNSKAPVSSQKRCSFVGINRLKSFAELSYSDCSESSYLLPK